MCKNFKEKGICRYGEKCLFAHGEHELTRRVIPEDLKAKSPETMKDQDVVTENVTLVQEALV